MIKSDPKLRERTRRCSNPRCQHLMTRRDELAGRCPMCHQILLSLAFEVAFVEGEKPDERQ